MHPSTSAFRIWSASPLRKEIALTTPVPIDTHIRLASMRQIHRAIDHCVDGEYECAITLAGAAEGILQDTDKPHFRQKEIEVSKSPEITSAGGNVGLNDYANWLKHGRLVRGGPRIENATIPAEESVKWVWRAISKYKAVYDDLTPQMLSFQTWAKNWLSGSPIGEGPIAVPTTCRKTGTIGQVKTSAKQRHKASERWVNRQA
jgi:hypothetical protein